MPANRPPLPLDPLFPSVAKDWLTGEKSPDVIWREGKWWTKEHYEFWRRDLIKDQQRVARNLDARQYLNSQPVAFK